MTDHDFAGLTALETSLWTASTRFDRAYMANVLAEGFFEFGCSGHRYSRDEILAMPAVEIGAMVPLDDFRIESIANGVALVTYLTRDGLDGERICRRSSLWVSTDGGWNLRFHQGTPIPPDR